MAQLGSVTLLMAMALSVYGLVGSLLGARRRIPELNESARYALYLIPLVLAVGIGTLVTAFVRHDFSIRYVADNSNRAMDFWLTWVAFYAGNAGSLLYISFVFSLLVAAAIHFAPKAIKEAMPHTSAVMASIVLFFVAVMYFLANPFWTLSSPPADGRGINPLLTHPGMFIHPPVMMTGLVSVAIPFAFATGALLAGKFKDEWVAPGRPWSLMSWGMLGLGNLLGAWWAYTILGWGGYWGWDPVEIAGIMPWFGLTALIHSLVVQERRHMFRMWNLALINISFLLASYGMFMNRAGPVPSVHSFGQSTIGWTFLAFFAFWTVFSFGLFFYRYSNLKSAQNLDSPLSREASFLINNFLLLSITFVTLWGVIFPLISQLVQGVTVTVAAPFFNKVNGPLFLVLIFLMGVSPLLPWRKASWTGLGRTLVVPSFMGLLVVVASFVLGVRSLYAVAAFGLCGLVVGGIFREWLKGTISRERKGEGYHLAFVRLVMSNKYRYGGYIVHLAVVLLALGVAGSALYNTERDVILSPGQRERVAGYQVEYVGSARTVKADRIERAALVRAYTADGKLLGDMRARNDFYPDWRMASTRSAIRSTPVEDLYIIPQEFFDDGRVALRILVNPLVWWMWVAGPVLLLGTMVLLWPQRKETTAYAPKRMVAVSTPVAGNGG